MTVPFQTMHAVLLADIPPPQSAILYVGLPPKPTPTLGKTILTSHPGEGRRLSVSWSELAPWPELFITNRPTSCFFRGHSPALPWDVRQTWEAWPAVLGNARSALEAVCSERRSSGSPVQVAVRFVRVFQCFVCELREIVLPPDCSFVAAHSTCHTHHKHSTLRSLEAKTGYKNGYFW